MIEVDWSSRFSVETVIEILAQKAGISLDKADAIITGLSLIKEYTDQVFLEDFPSFLKLLNESDKLNLDLDPLGDVREHLRYIRDQTQLAVTQDFIFPS